jgi:hypothetical protein
MEHPVFDITNPQACEHLLWGFAASVPNFHEEDGSGYALMADAILKVSCKLPGHCCCVWHERELTRRVADTLRSRRALL